MVEECIFKRSEVKVHNIRESLWTIIGDNVDDITGYLPRHPGGSKPLLRFAGEWMDCEFLLGSAGERTVSGWHSKTGA